MKNPINATFTLTLAEKTYDTHGYNTLQKGDTDSNLQITFSEKVNLKALQSLFEKSEINEDMNTLILKHPVLTNFSGNNNIVITCNNDEACKNFNSIFSFNRLTNHGTNNHLRLPNDVFALNMASPQTSTAFVNVEKITAISSAKEIAPATTQQTSNFKSYIVYGAVALAAIAAYYMTISRDAKEQSSLGH